MNSKIKAPGAAAGTPGPCPEAGQVDGLASISRRRFAAAAATVTTLTAFPFAAGRASTRNIIDQGLHAPAEWERHAGTLMAFPWDASDAWGGKLKDVQAEVAAVAKAVARFEPVIMIAVSASVKVL